MGKSCKTLGLNPFEGLAVHRSRLEPRTRDEPAVGNIPSTMQGDSSSGASGGRGAIVEICSYHGPYPGNFIPSLIATGRAVDERLGLDYHCLFPAAMRSRPWVRLVEAAGIEHSFIGGTRRFGLLAQLDRVVRSTDARLLRSHFSYWDVETGLIARRQEAVSVWQMHSGRFGRAPKLGSRLRDAVKVRALGGLCDSVFTVSHNIHLLAAARGFPERKIKTVLNGIDTERFSELPSRQDARAALGVSPSSPIALGFAWAPHTKGTDILVEAARPLGEAGELVVLLVGDRTSLERQFGGPSTSSWLKVIEPRDDVETVFAAADVFVSSSREEGFSYSIGEAMASGLPVISSDIEGPAQYFGAEGVTTFPSEDATALSASLRTVLQHSDRTALGQTNRGYIEAHLSLDAHVNRVVELFGELLAGKRRR